MPARIRNELHDANRRGWDACAPLWKQRFGDVWRQCPADPTLALRPRELAHLGNVRGKTICVLGSGDNWVVFALAGLGAAVTSVDISQVQLDIAAGRARELGLSINFIRADVTDLSELPDDPFDLVYTGGHVAVWVSDLNRYYGEAVRILRPGGTFLVCEYHPFRRIWADRPGPLEREISYFDRGPRRYDRSDGVPGAAPGSLPSFEFHWMVSEHASAMLQAGCELTALEEFGDGVEDWEQPSLAGLPACLLLVGRKPPGAADPG